MSAVFSQFCTASQAGYNALRQCIDLCARQEHSYEFPGCLMPDGCVPERALLGFSRQRDGSYLLYWRPAVDYHGSSRVLAALFRRNLWRFQSYETLAERLSSLRWELGRPTAAAAAAQNWPEPCLRLRALSIRLDRAEYLHPAPLRPPPDRRAAGLCGL